jgi:hypothetical protein
MANPEKRKVVSKKHLARVEREKIQRRYITIITMVVIVAVVILIGVGFVIEGVIRPRQPIAQVGDTTITTQDLQSRARYTRYLLVTEYLNTYQYLQSFGDPNALSYFESYLIQIQSELEAGTLGLNVINTLIEDEIIQAEAEKLGIEVAAEEVERLIDSAIFAYYPDGTPTPAPTTAIWSTPTLSAIQQVLVPPTPTAVLTPTEEVAPTPVEEAQPSEAGAEPTAIPPTPTPYTEKAYKSNYKDFMSYVRSYGRISEADIFDYYHAQLLRQRLAEALITDISTEEEVLWARHILFRDEETGEQQAEDFLARLDAGDDFVAVADELSLPPEDETEEAQIIFEDLGWFGEGDMVEPFETAALTLEIGEISQPVQTTFGWHVIQLLGRDIRARSQSDIDQDRSQAFQEWLNTQRLEYQVDINPEWIEAVPTSPDVPEQIKIQLPE